MGQDKVTPISTGGADLFHVLVLPHRCMHQLVPDSLQKEVSRIKPSSSEAGLLKPPVNFSRTTLLGKLKVAKRLYVIFTNPITHLFTKRNRNLGVQYW